jgi:thiamine transporter
MVATGGSVSFMMVPLFVLTFAFGGKEGAVSGLMVGMIKLILDSKKYGVFQMVLDYPIAFSVLGIASFFDNIYIGIIVACFLRYLVHVISGLIYFNASLTASMVINGGHMLTETILTLVTMGYLNKKGYISSIQRKF